MAVTYFEAVGRRKTSSARVRLYPGTGSIMVNEREMSVYFPRQNDTLIITRPLQMTEMQDAYNVSIHVEGGGLTGQAGAIAQGIARALCVADENLRSVLKKNGFLARDARAKERKKYGLKRARKAPQYTKR